MREKWCGTLTASDSSENFKRDHGACYFMLQCDYNFFQTKRSSTCGKRRTKTHVAI